MDGNTNKPGKGETIAKNKRATLGGKTNTNRRKPRQNNNRNRGNATTNNNRRKRKNDFSIFGEREDSEKGFSLSSVFSSLHNIQNQINMKQMDDSAFNVAKLKQVKTILVNE